MGYWKLQLLEFGGEAVLHDPDISQGSALRHLTDFECSDHHHLQAAFDTAVQAVFPGTTELRCYSAGQKTYRITSQPQVVSDEAAVV